MGFVDEARLYIKGGDGGDGCISFRRERFVPKGGPNGGDGGRGGNVYLMVDAQLHSLLDFRYRSHFKAERGGNGQGKDKHGRRGKDCVVRVPAGSVIKDDETEEVLADLQHDGETYLVAQGGKGGYGNTRFASSTNRAPRKATSGKLGEERWLRIELKLIADVGLIGLPNAGKSTLLSRLSAANPKIAPYPFTTLEPQLGVLHFPWTESCIIADIPGLIEGAHQGVGLGHQFLRHIERTSILVHVLDASTDARDPISSYKTIMEELGAYDQKLPGRQQIVVLNKSDLVSARDMSRMKQSFAECSLDVIPLSALTGEGLKELKDRLGELLENFRQVKEHDAAD
ncbi:MAG: GTPase ObgE [Desulfobulbus propionicus]|nr:MAG: GTPase ObgE [Desulfobulbus propionicus]